MMTAFLQMHDGRGRGRQPHVLHLDDGLAVDGEVMSAGHLLADIQHDSVISCLISCEIHRVDISLSYLTPATFGRGDIHHFTGASSFLFVERPTSVIAGIEIRQSVVVPQDAIALA